MAGALVKGIAEELQDEILSCLLFDNEMYYATQDVITEPFFTGEDYKLLFKALTQFHIETNANPNLKDIMIQVSLLLNNSKDILRVKDLLLKLYNAYIDDYVCKEYDIKKYHFEEFIKRNGAEYCFTTVIQDAKSDDGIDWMKVIPEFRKYTDFSIVSSSPYNMGNIDDIPKVQEEALGTPGSSKKIKYFIKEVNDSLNHDALLPGTLTCIVAAPGKGKSMSLINQGVRATKDGFTNLHVFLGDLNKNSARLRYLANYAQKSLSELIHLDVEEQQELSKSLNESGPTKGALSKNWILPLVAGRTTVEQLCTEIEKIQLKNNIHFDQIIIDYDGNIKPTIENIYESGGQIYNYLREFGIKNKSVMLVASQPKISFFNEEIIPLDGCGESSQKQHIIDLLITIGKPGKLDAPLGIMYIPKNRDGWANKKIWLYLDGSKQTMTSIGQEEYDRLKREAISNNLND